MLAQLKIITAEFDTELESAEHQTPTRFERVLEQAPTFQIERTHEEPQIEHSTFLSTQTHASWLSSPLLFSLFYSYLSCASIYDEIFAGNLVPIFYFDFSIIFSPLSFSRKKSCDNYLLRTPIVLFILFILSPIPVVPLAIKAHVKYDVLQLIQLIQVQLGGYESPVLVHRSQLKNITRSAVAQCIDQLEKIHRPFSSVGFKTRIHFLRFGNFPRPLTPTTDTRCGTRSVLRTPYNPSFEFYSTTKHYNRVIELSAHFDIKTLGGRFSRSRAVTHITVICRSLAMASPISLSSGSTPCLLTLQSTTELR